MTDDNYQGPGKFWSTFGGWLIGGAIGGTIVVLMTPFLPTLTAFGVAALFAFEFTCSITGAVLGYQRAKNGEQQYEASREQAATQKPEIYREHGQEIGAKRFTDYHQSRATLGTHADTALARQEALAHPTR